MKNLETVKAQEKFLNNLKSLMSKSGDKELTLEEHLKISKELERELKVVLEHMQNENTNVVTKNDK